MRRDLKDTVAGCVNDRLACSNVLFAKLLDDFGAGGGLVTDRAAANLLFERFDDFALKAVRINREGLIEPDARHFPVTRRRVFAGRMCGAFSERSDRSGSWRQMFEWRDVSEPHLHEHRNLKGPRLGDVSERISTDVAIVCRVRQRADADAVQHNPGDPFKRSHHVAPAQRPDSSIAAMAATLC